MIPKHPLVYLLAALVLAGLVMAAGSPSLAQQGDPPLPGDEVGTYLTPIRSSSYRIGWSVLGSSSGTMASASFRLRSTLGQPAIGNVSSASFRLHSGFWQWMAKRVYMPMVLNR